MENITEYLFVDLYDNDKVVNRYTLPKTTFTMNSTDLVIFLDDIFKCMINDLSFVKDSTLNLVWSSVKFYIVNDSDVISEIIKTKSEMESNQNYGEVILDIHNSLINL